MLANAELGVAIFALVELLLLLVEAWLGIGSYVLVHLHFLTGFRPRLHLGGWLNGGTS